MNQTGRLTEVTVPHLAESLVSATIGKWLKKPGDYIEQYDVLCELFTEKVNTEMPSPIEGKLIKIIVGDGETAAVGEAICVIEEPAALRERYAATSCYHTAASVAAEDTDQSMRGRFSPAVHKLAQDNRVDLARVAGTGLGGRITRKDVETYIASVVPMRHQRPFKRLRLPLLLHATCR